MKVESRNVYIADGGEEFDSEEMCIRHEAINKLSQLLSGIALVNEYYSLPIASAIFDNFNMVKNIVEGTND